MSSLTSFFLSNVISVSSSGLIFIVHLTIFTKMGFRTHYSVIRQFGILNFFFFFFLFRATYVAYGGSQARGPFGAVAAGLSQSRSNARSELYL